MSNTSITGTLDIGFCNPITNTTNNNIVLIHADCGGPLPEIECSCCTTCCDDDSGECTWDIPRLCQNVEDRYIELLGDVDCACDEESAKLTCNFLDDCPTCNEDGTVCGRSTDFGYDFIDDYFTIITNSFTYDKGRNDTVTWLGNDVELICEVEVNGELCNSCSFSYCPDGFNGLFMDCSNIVEGNSGVYDSCGIYVGGVFDVFEWMESYSFVGCPFSTYFAI